MDPSNFCPPYITDLLHSLETHEFSNNTLKSSHLRPTFDPLLSQFNTYFNFPNTHQFPNKCIPSQILTEYINDFPPIDEELPKSSDFFQIDNPDLTADFVKEDLFESKSVSSYQSEDTNCTPLKHSSKTKRVPRSKNGLKALSSKVKEIVERLGSSTYQEVADCLIREEIDLKAEKNIRRRVYDALNVLIAVGVLKKYSKTVKPTRKLQIDTQEKVRNLKDITEKFLRLKALIERNKEEKGKHQNLFMPFSLIAVPKKEDSPAKVVMNLHRNCSAIRLDSGFVVKNCDKVLKELELEVRDDWVPKEVRVLCNFSNNSLIL